MVFFRRSAECQAGRNADTGGVQAGDVTDHDSLTRRAMLAVGVTALGGVAPRTACLLYCHEFVTGLLGAAQRLFSLGHTDAQRVLDGLKPVMVDATESSADRPLDSMSAFAPLVDVLSADHERADRRLFSS